MASQIYTFDGPEGTKASTLPGIVVGAGLSDAFAVLDGKGGVKNMRRAADSGVRTGALLFDTGSQNQKISVIIGEAAIPTSSSDTRRYLLIVRGAPGSVGSPEEHGVYLCIQREGAVMYLRLEGNSQLYTRTPAVIVPGDWMTLEVRTSTDRTSLRFLGYVNDELLIDHTRIASATTHYHNANYTGVGFRTQATDDTGTLFTHMEVGEYVDDLVVPVLSSPSATGSDVGTVVGSLTASEPGKAYAVLTASSTKPPKTAIKAGVGLAAAQAILVAGENPAALTFTGLAQGVKLHMHAYQTDYASPIKNESEIVTSPAFISAGEPDSVAPILTLPTIEPSQLGMATGGITTNESGMSWSVLTGSATKPAASAVIAGTGVAAANALLVAGLNPEVYHYTALPEATQLWQHTTQRDNADIPNTALVVTSPPFTTSKQMTLPEVNGITIVNPVSSGRTLRAGPNHYYKTPSAAISNAQAGDTVLIDAGEYPGDVVAWYTPGLHIKGVGGKVILRAAGKSSQAKAIWVMGAPNTIIENIEFRDCRVNSRNGAGIRVENLTGYFYVKNCNFFDNENGILSSYYPIRLIVEDCVFGRNSENGAGGQCHNIYVGDADTFECRRSFFHEANYGSNIKSRAKNNLVEHCYVMDGTGETAKAGSYCMDFSNGGVVKLVGNMVYKSARAHNNTMIVCGTEGKKYEENTLEMINNTLVCWHTKSSSGRSFIRLRSWWGAATLKGNILASETGEVALLYPGELPESSVVQIDNIRTKSEAYFGASSLTAPNFWPGLAEQAKITLAALPDGSYTVDSPSPLVTRTASEVSPKMGALQSSPHGAVTPLPGVQGDLRVPVVIPPADTTAPVVTISTLVPDGVGRAKGDATTTKAGPAWALVTTSATKPSIADIKAGIDGVASSYAILAQGSNYGRFIYPDFGEGVQLYQHIVQEDTATPPNVSAVTTSVRFTTTSAAGGGGTGPGTGPGTGARRCTVTLTSDGTTPMANVTGIAWAWWDAAIPNFGIAAVSSGIGATTNATGVLDVALPNSTLNAGQVGTLLAVTTDGNPVGLQNRALCKPIVVS